MRDALSPEYRAASLQRMRDEHFDVVVIGGGVTGAGAAVDAATRGLKTALVEQRDWAAGTSSRSSKLIHGGLRYLEQFNFGLVREALTERGLLLNRLAPHLVRPVPFLYPLTKRVWERFYIGAGVTLYDNLGGAKQLPRHRHLTHRGALKLAPALRPDSLIGALQYWDAQVDDARFVATLGRTAARHGAAQACSARVIGLIREGDRVAGVTVRDLESGQDIDVRARQVINATGVWANQVQEMAGRGRVSVRPSKGIHLVVPRDRIHADSGLILRTEKSVLFLIPWGRHWLIGTTDTDWELDLAHPAASRTDMDYLLNQVNAGIRPALRHQDVQGVYAGLRPLLFGEDEATSKLSREHAVAQTVSGLITIAGGKYTTYRVMAEDVIDAAAHGIDRRVPPACTDRIVLVGGHDFPAVWNGRYTLANETGLHLARIEHLLRRYGSRIGELLDYVTDQGDLGKPIAGADDYLAVEAVHAVTHEGALHVDDVLTRRTRISIETWDRGWAAARPVAELMAPHLGWDESTVELEVEHYYARVRAERESQAQPDDRTADAARMGASDVRGALASQA